MILNGLEFGYLFWASGAVNFFGEGWWYDKYLNLVPGYSSRGITETGKTVTLESRLGSEKNGESGNMVLNDHYQTKKWLPDCVKIYWLKGLALNAVGLSGPGLAVLLEKGFWQVSSHPFIISLMATGSTKKLRLLKMAAMGGMFRKEILKDFPYSPRWARYLAFEQNISCPNVQHDPRELEKEAIEQLLFFRAGLSGCFDEYFERFSSIDFKSAMGIINSISGSKLKSGPFGKIPTGVKASLLTKPSSMKEIVDSGFCDFISIPNTVPWLELPEKISWKKFFGTMVSPLQKYGGGGLSGWPLTSLTADWIFECRKEGIIIPINAGSIYKKSDVSLMRSVGADGIIIGCVKFLRPWRLEEIKEQAREEFAQ